MKSILGIAFAALVPALLASTAGAAPRIAVTDGGDTVTIEAHGVAAAQPAAGDVLAAIGRSDRVEIPLAGPMSEHTVMIDDGTVKRVDVAYRHADRLSIQLRHGRRTTELMARTAEIVATGDLIRVTLQRDPEAYLAAQRRLARRERAAAEVAPQPARTEPAPAPAQPPAPASPPAPAPATDAPAAAAPAGPALEPDTTATEPATPAPTTDEASAATTEAPAIGQPPRGSSGMGAVGALLILALAGSGALVWWARKKKPGEAPGNLEVVASRAIGPKAKLVLVNAGERELLLSVNDSGARLLSQWDSDTSVGAAPRGLAPASALGDELGDALAGADADEDTEGDEDTRAAEELALLTQAKKSTERDADFSSIMSRVRGRPGARLYGQRAATRPEPAPEPAPAPVRVAVGTGRHETEKDPRWANPAVAGILKLRREAPDVNPSVATDDPDADAEWARELMLATRGGRR